MNNLKILTHYRRLIIELNFQNGGFLNLKQLNIQFRVQFSIISLIPKQNSSYRGTKRY